MLSLDDLNASQLQAVGSNLSQDANKYENRDEVELSWAMKAFHHAETHFNLISSVDPKILKLTPIDDEIYSHFKKAFPDFQLDVIQEDQLKSEAAKEAWREFIGCYKGKVQDYDFGTLLRERSKDPFGQDNSIFVVRIQFLAIEIARNREGFNDGLRKKKTDSKNEEKKKTDSKAEER